MSERAQEILLIQRMFASEVDRLLERVESAKGDPARYTIATREAQCEFNRLDSWFMRQIGEPRSVK
jgi:hypothetical protein